MNAGDLRNKETGKIIAQRLTKMKIDIAMIQETHQMCDGERGGDIYFLYNRGRKE